MKTIKVKYLNWTDTKPSRWKASDSDRHSFTISTSTGNSRDAAIGLCKKMNWSTDLVGGSYGDSDYYNFRDSGA